MERRDQSECVANSRDRSEDCGVVCIVDFIEGLEGEVGSLPTVA